MSHIFSHHKLIGRDEKSRFQSDKDKSEEERIREEYLRLTQRKEVEGSGGDITLNIKNFSKSLKDLAGGDDSIFAIIDDRADVW